MSAGAEAAAVGAVGAEVPPGYRVLGLLAEGRRTLTCDALDLDRDCRVVLKVLRPDRAGEARAREALLREGRVVTTLAHPHLVRGLELHVDPPALVLETLPGDTLAALVDDGPLDVADSARLGLQLVSVLGYLHRHGWLHLDVKPPNVVVRGGQAVLIDLGLAGRPGEGRPGAGTRGYLAPEQALGRDLGPHTDVWGLGVTLVECLTGEMPFGDEATWESRRRVPLLHRPMPREPGPLPAHLPRAYAELLRACLALRSADRPSLADVRGVLSSLADDPAEPLATLGA